MTRPLNSIEACALNERRASLRADGTLGAPISLIKATDRCTRCGADCAPASSIEIDPLCTACNFDLIARDEFLTIIGPNDLPANLLPFMTCFCGAPITAIGAMRCWYHLYN
jgi:hypothetical protein